MLKTAEVSTTDLTEELSKRAGVKRIIIEPHQEFKIQTGHEELTFQGPAIVLVNQD